MNVNLSRNQVLVSCSTDEEAKKLHAAIVNLPEDSLDDLLGELPRLQTAKVELTAEVTELKNAIVDKDQRILDLELEIEGLKLGAKPNKKVTKKSKN